MLSTTPIECPEGLLQQAKAYPKTTTAVVNAGKPLPLQSCRMATEQGLIEPVLVGNRSNIELAAKEINWDISGYRLVEAEGEVTAAQTSVALAKNGEVKSLMKGDVHTDQLLRAVLNKETGLRTGNRLSHVFHMTVPGSDKALCITDAVINVQPDITTKLHIARNAVGLMHALGNTMPKIAVLSATEIATPAMPSSMEANELATLASNEIEGAYIDGPFAFDNAISPEAAKIKGVQGPVAGQAEVLLVPNIETGNALFKQMVYFMSAAAAGVVLGAAVPIILTSRADPAAARLAGTALASIYANNQSYKR